MPKIGVIVPDSARKQEPERLSEQIDKLEYVENMLREMLKIANGIDAATLSYLLEMAVIEARETLDGARRSGGMLSQRK